MGHFFLIVSMFVVLCGTSSAEIKSWETIDNAGLNQAERIEAVDKYLVELSTSLKRMESKLDENALKLKQLDEVVKVMKEAELKRAETQVGEKKSTPEAGTKDLTEALKNKDIEKLKVDFKELEDTVKALQATLRSQLK